MTNKDEVIRDLEKRIRNLENEKRSIEFRISGFIVSEQEKEKGEQKLKEIDKEISRLKDQKTATLGQKDGILEGSKGIFAGALGGLALGSLATKLLGKKEKNSPQSVNPQIEENSESTITCDCGNKVKSSAKFCNNCGKEMIKPASTKFCPKCGSQNDSISKFCKDCGTKLD